MTRVPLVQQKVNPQSSTVMDLEMGKGDTCFAVWWRTRSRVSGDIFYCFEVNKDSANAHWVSDLVFQH